MHFNYLPPAGLLATVEAKYAFIGKASPKMLAG